MSDNEKGAHSIGGTAESWRRLVEELQRAGEGKFLITMNGKMPVAISRIAQPFRLNERDER